jgi:hypothetical protein
MNVNEKLCPDARSRELKRPPSAVTVWAEASRFVNVTRVPIRTLRLDGLKAKLMIWTDAAIGGGAVGGIVGRGVVTTGCGAGVATGVGGAVGDAVGAAVGLTTAVWLAKADWDGGDWLVACVPQPMSKHAATIANACRSISASVKKSVGG